MKAIRIHEFGPPETMRWEEMEEPKPADGQVLVKIHAAGVNPVETYVRSGSYARKPELPYTPGTDGAGVVVAVGENVIEWEVGDRVYTSGSLTGTYAELALCLDSQVHPLPEHVSFEQGAALGLPYGTAYRALFQKALAEPSEILLIHGGTGGVGLAGLQFARAAGMTIIATGGSEKGRALLADQGAALVLDHTRQDYMEEIRAFTDGYGVDVVLEMLANANLDKDLQVLAPHGRVVVIGNRGTVEINPRLLMGQESMVIGMMLSHADESDLAVIHAAIVAGLANDTLSPVIGESLHLNEAVQAHRRIMEPGAYGKIVLVNA